MKGRSELDDRSGGRRGFVRRLFEGVGAAVVAGMLAVRTATRAEGADGPAPPSADVRQRSPVGGLDHVAIPIRNVDQMIGFYRALGFEVREGDPIVSIHFRDQKINFHRPGLWQRESFTLRASAARPPCGDFCWVWEESEDVLRETLGRAGAEIAAEGERRGGRDRGRAVGRSLYTRDPDGNLLEFIRY